MSRYGSADVGFLILTGRNVLGDTTRLEDNREALLEEVTALGDAYEAHAAVGVSRYRLTQQGFFNDASGRSNEALLSPGGDDILSFAPEGNTLGNKFVGALGIQTTYTRQLERAGLHKANAAYESRGGHEECLILAALQAFTADGDTTSAPLDGGAQSTSGGVAYLQVTALDLDGYDSVTITILDDADDCGCYGTLQAFTNVTAVGGERIEIAGTIERYTAIDVAFNGSGCCPSITLTVGLKRN